MISLSFSDQLETKSGKAADALDPPDLKVALKREREEHQHLLADSYAAVMDLTKQVSRKVTRTEQTVLADFLTKR